MLYKPPPPQWENFEKSYESEKDVMKFTYIARDRAQVAGNDGFDL